MRHVFVLTGDGGAGGLAGSAGSINLVGFDKMPNSENNTGNFCFIWIRNDCVKSSFASGVNGLDGQGGSAGKTARDGRLVSCTIWHNTLFWGHPIWFVSCHF